MTSKRSGLSLITQYETSSSDSSDSEGENVQFTKYRSGNDVSDLSSSESDNYNLDDDDDVSTVDTESVCTETGDIKRRKPQKDVEPYPEENLPPVEDLHISVPRNFCAPMGSIKHFVDGTFLIVVESHSGIPPLNLDSILFLDNGERVLGQVYDVIGSVNQPHYVIRFNSQEHLDNAKIEPGMVVYYAPLLMYTKYVFMRDVLANKGSDASWIDNQEVPNDQQEFSDDEKEQCFNRSNANNKKRTK